MLFLPLILFWQNLRCLHMCSEKFFNVYFHDQIEFKPFLVKGDRAHFFCDIIAYEQ